MCGIDCTAVVRKALENTEKEFEYECSPYYVTGCNFNIDNTYTAARI